MVDKLMVGRQEVEIVYTDGVRGANLPYAFTVGVETFAGMLYIRDPLENSYTDGYFAGVVTGNYHLDKENGEVCADNGLIKACIRLDIAGRALFGQVCYRKPFDGWDCSDWKRIISW